MTTRMNEVRTKVEGRDWALEVLLLLYFILGLSSLRSLILREFLVPLALFRGLCLVCPKKCQI